MSPFDQLIQSFKQGSVLFLGLLCALMFAINAGLLLFLIMRQKEHGLARCPKCGRSIACPHCAEDDRQSLG